MPRVLFLFGLLITASCGDDDGGTPATDAGTGGGLDAPAPAIDSGISWPTRIGGDRPARVVVPRDYDGSTPTPLMFLLHGYTTTALIQDAYWGVSAEARRRGFLLVLPDGTEDSAGNPFWNATPACCDFGGTDVDDVAYLRGLIAEMKSEFNVDAARVYFVGHSNGGFMSYRMACEAAGEITAIMSLAGADFLGDMDCVPAQPVSVLQVHGTLDDTVPFGGMAAAYPSAEDAVRRWAERAGCDPATTTMGANVNVDTNLPGDETTVTQWQTGCMPGLDAELWTIEGGSHTPALDETWAPLFSDWLFRHSR